jgi:hypothetical protein
MKRYIGIGAAVPMVLLASTALAATDADIKALKQDIRQMRATYESRINQLETQVQALETGKPASDTAPVAVAATEQHTGSGAYDNHFNPAIGMTLNGTYANFSNDRSVLGGFAVGDEGGRLPQGLSLGESELTFGANIDDKFEGNLVASIGADNSLGIEEGYIQTRGGTLPGGLNLKAGRSLWTLGYLNEHHAHTDDFADRPLPYRAFLNGAYNDDGAQLSWVLPTDHYAELGGGVYRGDVFPFGTAGGNGFGAWSAYARTGGDITDNQSWQATLSTLQGNTANRSANDDTVTFTGDSNLYLAALRYNWAPTGNPAEKELTLQGEYFTRHENGTYDDQAFGTGPVGFNGNSNGWYAQAVYKFLPQWRVGARVARLDAPYVPVGLLGSALDANGHDPYATSAMLDWTNSEFSRIRLQYNNEALSNGQTDNQVLLQYTMSLGAHGAHQY